MIESSMILKDGRIPENWYYEKLSDIYGVVQSRTRLKRLSSSNMLIIQCRTFSC